MADSRGLAGTQPRSDLTDQLTYKGNNKQMSQDSSHLDLPAMAALCLLLVVVMAMTFDAPVLVDGSSLPECPDGSKPEDCVSSSPCSDMECQSFPNATCVMDACGGCTARFFIDTKEVTKDCCSSPPFAVCSDEKRLPCYKMACKSELSSCTNFPTAKCMGDFCVECVGRWLLPDCREVTGQCKHHET
ncbi:hypothetical protein BsWGS_07854 [Bradybaena similaris]